jgi:hypothetical protein
MLMLKILLPLLLTASVYGQSVVDSHFHVDQVGYRPSARKIAVISDPQTGYNAPDPYTPGATLEVRQAFSNTVVFSGAPVAWNGGATHVQSGDKAWWFDFSSVTTSGEYYINDPSTSKRSYVFRISATAYNDALMHATRMFYYQRCGTPKIAAYAGSNYTDVTCHHGAQQDLDCRDVTNQSVATSRDLSGGWHDAGDYNKYTNFTLAPVHYLLDAYESSPAAFGDYNNIPESGNGTADMLDELKWELDWLLKMQNADGSALMKVSTLGFTGGSPPSSENQARFYGGAASSATRTVCSEFAHAAIVFRQLSDPAMQAYGDTLLARAQLAWTWLQNNPGYSNYANTGFSSANPEVSTYDQDALSITAAVYLYAATGTAAYRTYVDNNYGNIHCLQWSYWYPFESVYQNALLYYTATAGATNSVASAIRADCISSVSSNNTDLLPAYIAQTDPYMAFMKDQDYVWNNNQFKAETGYLFANMNRYGLDAANQSNYRNAAEGYIHYIHGVNATGFCFLSNGGVFGADNSIRQIYHGWFGDGTIYDESANYIGPPPGYLTCGVNAFYNPDAAYSGPPISPPQNQPVQKSYKDWNTSWPENSWEISEVGIYTNASYVKLLAMYADTAVIPLSVCEGCYETAPNGIYPVPASDEIVMPSGFSGKAVMEIYDLGGRLMLSQTVQANERVSITALSAAVYFCKLRQENGIITTQKIIISRR